MCQVPYAYQSKGSPGVLAWQAIDKHIGLRSDNGRVDEAQEEESSNQRADGKVRGVRVFSL